MIPTTKLFDGDAETIGNSDHRISAPNGVTLWMHAGRRGDWNDEFVTLAERFTGSDTVGFSDL